MDGKPKVLAPISGRPYLAFLLDWLQAFGAKRIILGLGHLAGEVEGYLGANPVADLTVDCFIEPEPLGTGGAIRFLRRHLRSELVMVMNGDSFVGADLCAFVANQHAPAILCTHIADAGRYGAVEVDAKGRICAFNEKEPISGAGVINAGVYLFDQDMLDRIDGTAGPSLEVDVFQKMEPGSLHAFVGNFDFIDIGTPDSLARAPQVLKSIFIDFEIKSAS